jgi:N-acetylmuramoyl-L-alanine amidase
MVAVVIAIVGAQTPAAPGPYTVVTRDARRPLPARVIAGQEMVPLDELARLFDLTVREEAAAGGLTVSTRTQTIALTAGQTLASVGGRLVSMPGPPVRDGRVWFVPVEFVSAALAPALGTRLELRKSSRLILVGDVRIPQIAARVESQGGSARVIVDVSPAAPHSITREGNRVLVRFDADALDATLPTSPVPDLIQSVRSDGATTIAIDLGPRVISFKSADVPGDRGAVRIVIDVAAQTTDAQPPPPPPPSSDLPPLLELTPPGGLRTIVIDPGHGGAEDGAHGAGGTLEKNVTLSVARRLKAALEGRLGVRVVLTRDGDATVGLDERAALANNNKADLLVSLHANASVRSGISGAQVFYLSLEEYGEEGARAAHGEGASIPVFGGGAREIEVILWELAQARYIERSAALAQSIEAALRGQVPMSPRALQQAPFRVLVGANMPAVLIEMGFLSNPEQEKQLTSDAFQDAFVRALVDGLVRFRDAGVSRDGAGDAAAPTHRGPALR